MSDISQLSNDELLALAQQHINNSPQPSINPDFVNQMSPMQKGLAGAGKAFVDVGRGIKQRLGLASQQDIDEAAQLDKPLMNTTAGTVGNIGGSLAIASPLALVPGANTLAGGAALGAIQGAIQPTQTGQNPYTNTLTGAGMGVAIPIAGAGIRTVKSAVEPFTQIGRQNIAGRALTNAAGENAPEVIDRLKNAAILIPGSYPTAGDVAQSGGISAMQRAATQAFPEPYTTRQLQQQAARLQALRGVGQDAQSIADAEFARNAVTSPLYQSANKAELPITPDLQGIIDKLPQGVMNRAADLARQEKSPFIIGNSQPEQQVATGVLDASGNPIMTTIPAKQAQISGSALGYINKALQDVISGAGDTQIGMNAKRLATQTRQDLLSFMDENIPAHKFARELYQSTSEPINQMQVGQSLLDKITPALSDFGALGKETAAKYAQALRNSLQTVKNSTGFEQPIEKIMNPEQMNTLNNIAADLARKSNAQELGRGIGSNTFQNFAMDNIASQSGYPRISGMALGGINGMMGNLPFGLRLLSPQNMYSGKEKQIQQIMADLLLNPQEAGRVMESSNKSVSPMVQLLQRSAQVPFLAAPGIVPAISNSFQQ